MRLHEIYGEEEISQNLKSFFIVKKYSIFNGAVKVVGGLKLKKKVSELPVEFDSVTGRVYFNSSKLTSLGGSPRIVGDFFNCSDNQLTSLKGGPTKVGASYLCNSNQLSNLIGAPEEIIGDFSCQDNPLTSLDGLPKSITRGLHITCSPNLPLLKIFFVENLSYVQDWSVDADGQRFRHNELQVILNRYLRQGQAGVLACAAELTRAGYRGNARR